MAALPPSFPQPRRGQIWFVSFPGDPVGKSARPVLIVSMDGRNAHPRAETVLAVPFSTTLTDLPIHVRLNPGETGLPETSELQPENISVIRKQSLKPAPNSRTLGETILRRVARGVVLSMGIQPRDIG